MAIPEEVIRLQPHWRMLFAACELLDAKAKRLAGCDWDLDAYERVLDPLEFDALVLIHFDGCWDNSGRFIDTLYDWAKESDRVTRAFRTFGCNHAADLVPIALELKKRVELLWEQGEELPEGLRAEYDRINDMAARDASEEKLAAVICERRNEFLRKHG